MRVRIDTLPDWTFEIDEVSAGLYELHGAHLSGASINLTGADPDKLIETAKDGANSMQRNFDRPRRS